MVRRISEVETTARLNLAQEEDIESPRISLKARVITRCAELGADSVDAQLMVEMLEAMTDLEESEEELNQMLDEEEAERLKAEEQLEEVKSKIPGPVKLAVHDASITREEIDAILAGPKAMTPGEREQLEKEFPELAEGEVEEAVKQAKRKIEGKPKGPDEEPGELKSPQ